MGFIRYTMPDFQPSVHHHALTEKLDEVIAGTCTRLIVTMPPRHGKSEIGSKKLPAYFLGKKTVTRRNLRHLQQRTREFFRSCGARSDIGRVL
jgi:hypothetical protein